MKDMQFPKVIFGTSCLGNLFHILPEETKQDLVKECFAQTDRPVYFDTAGKYGAGLALESLGACLRNANVKPEDVVICNKLGWVRTELKTPEPTFEPGVWKGLKYDAVQRISYDGIIECYHQGNELLKTYRADLVSVHDPDEYLAAATDEQDEKRRYQDILDAYRALFDLKAEGEVTSVGIGAKDWKTIRRITQDVKLDWVMVANSMTIHSHPQELLTFLQKLKSQGIPVINSAVFNGGFLTGGDFYNYKPTNPEKDAELYKWREDFYKLCDSFKISPATAAIVFGRKIPGVAAIALSTTKPHNVAKNFDMAVAELPDEFWQALVDNKMIDPDLHRHLINN
ncbi:MAG: aldo/keto reductase [Mucilaginibacter sp.]